MGAGPTRALTGGRRTKPTSTGCRRLRQPEPGRRSTYQAGEPVQTNRASSDGASHRVLGADGHFYRRQVEGFADVVLDGATMEGASIDDGVASVRAMVAIARSAESGEAFAP